MSPFPDHPSVRYDPSYDCAPELADELWFADSPPADSWPHGLSLDGLSALDGPDDIVREPPPDEGPPPPPGWLPPSDELPPDDDDWWASMSREHPWAGVPSWREAEWDVHRATKTAARSAAQASASAAFKAFVVSGDGAAACALLAGDSEALFELGLAAERWERGTAGLKHRALAGFVTARQAESDPVRAQGPRDVGVGPQDYLAEEVGLALAMAPRSAGKLLDDCTDLVERLPATLAAVEAGTIDLARARAMLRTTSSLSLSHARTVEDRVLARGGRPSGAAFQRAARRAADAADPAAAADRARVRRADRHVWKHQSYDGAAVLSSQLPAEIVEAIWQRLTHLARRARTRHDKRTLDQARADVLTALLLGHNAGDLAASEGRSVPAEVQVLVHATTLAGLDDLPAHLAGHGSIPAELARALADNAALRRVVLDRHTGSVVDVGRRHPATALRHLVETSTAYCQHPGCPHPAGSCQIDHTRPHSQGGPTEDANLGPACQHHHRMKDEDTGWKVEQPEPGHFVVTTPAGRTYTSHPEPVWGG